MKTQNWAAWACALAFGPISGVFAGANPVSPPQAPQDVDSYLVASGAFQKANYANGAVACNACHAANPGQSVVVWDVYNHRKDDWVGQLQAQNEAIAARFYVEANREDDILGATLSPVNEALRAQLDLPEGQGLLVETLADGGAAAKAGLQRFDVLLSLNDQPLPTREVFQEKLKATHDKTLKLGLLRGRKETTLLARPVTWVTLGPAAPQAAAREYFIGVSLEAMDEPLRVNLGLKEGEGVLIKEVVADSPAAKAGVKAYDIALKLGDQPVESVEGFRAQVQKLGETQTTLSGLRNGKPFSITVTPAVRAASESGNDYIKLMVGQEDRSVFPFLVNGNVACPAAKNVYLDTLLSRRAAARIDALNQAAGSDEADNLRQEVKALREAVERLEKALNAKK
ncbi:MAG: site-2 protease family protein [Isosphaeraceae bacterium]